MTERERWEELLSQDIPVMVKAPFTGEPMCIDLLQFGTTELESFINFLVSHGAILPPVKIGQIIYDIDGEDVCELKVLCISYFCDSYTMNCLRAGCIEETQRRNKTIFDIEIGKYVFFTREEAEAALERRKEVNTT